MPTSTPAPGWYADQTNSEQLRWWDGQAWTEHTKSLSSSGNGHTDVVTSGWGSPTVQPVAARSAVKNPWYFRWWAITAAVLVALSILGSLLPNEETLGADAPADQKGFIATVAKAQKQAEESDNEMRVVADRKARNASLCGDLPDDLAISGWIGTVTELDTTLGGDSGVITIELAEDIEVSTWNNGFSDIGDKTLIAEDSSLYMSLTALSEDDKVVFSGMFVGDDENCLREKSVTDRGGMESPTFIMRFTSLSAK